MRETRPRLSVRDSLCPPLGPGVERFKRLQEVLPILAQPVATGALGADDPRFAQFPQPVVEHARGDVPGAGL